MTAIDDYMHELESALHVGGREKHRFLVECHDHLVYASAADGPAAAIHRFGSPSDLASSFDTEISVRRGLSATVATAVGVVAVAASTWAMLQQTDPHASRVLVWAIVFFACAQTSAACLGLAVLRAGALRYEEAVQVREVAVLDRRNALALVFALLTQFAAAAALPGRAPAWVVLGGPAIALLALICVGRVHALARRVNKPEGNPRAGHAPLIDLVTLVGRSPANMTSTWKSQSLVLSATTVAAVAAAFSWNRLDHGTVAGSQTVAGTEGVFVLMGFVLLGPALDVWSAKNRLRG